MNKNIFLFFLFLINTPYLSMNGADKCNLQDFNRSIKEYATQPSSNPDVLNTLYITHSLIKKTQDFFNTNQDLFSNTLLTSCSDNVATIIDHLSKIPFKKKSLLNVIQSTLNDVCPLYTYLAIGSLSDLEETSHHASLISAVKPLKTELSIEHFNEILAMLIGIAQEYRSKSHNLEELLRFYSLTGLCDNGDVNIQKIKNEKHSLLEQLQSKNIDFANSSSDSFFSTAKELIHFDKQHKIQLIQSLLGDPYDSNTYYTVLGNINEIATFPVSTPNKPSLLFQRMLIGQNEFKQSYPNHTRSLFSNVFEIRSITETLLQNMDISNMHQLIRHIGLWGDTTPQSLFGSLAILKKRFSDPAINSFENFDEAFGLSEQPRSCCGHVLSLKKELIQHFNILMDPDTEACLFYLSPDTIIKLISLPPNANKNTIKRIILDDFIEHINGKKDQPPHEGSLIFQLNKLYQSIASFSEKSHIADRIGTQLKNGNFSSFSFRIQLNRFIEDLLSSDNQSNDYPFASMENLDYSYLYRIFFGNINSIQARLYEITARQINDNQNYADIIGSILSQDQSMFGLINHVIKKFEIEPILTTIGSRELKLDENGSIVDKLYCIVNNIEKNEIIDEEIEKEDEKNKKIEEILEQLKSSIGIAYTPYSLSNISLINLMIYFKDIFNQSFPIIPREKTFQYAHYIYKSDKNIPYNISDLVNTALNTSKNSLDKTLNICGIINDQIGTSIWVQTNAILNGLYDDILGLIQSNHEEDGSAQERDGSLAMLLSKLQAADSKNTIDFVETKIKKLNTFIDLFQKQHFHLSLNSLVQNIFGILPEYTEMINFNILDTYDTADHSLEPIGLLEAIYNSFPDKHLISYGSINDLITEKTLCGYLNNMLYTMISKPLLDLLYRNPHNSDVSETNNIFTLLKILKEETERHPDLFEEEKNKNKDFVIPIGSDQDELTEENLNFVTIFALFNEILRILSQTHLFMETPTLYTNIKNILQDCYDTEKDATKRSLFSNLNYILEKFKDNESYTENKTNIRDAIGNKKDNKYTTRKTIYQSLNSIIDNIIADYKYFIFKDNFPLGGIHFDANLSIMDHLNTMNHILDDPYYGISIQNKDEVFCYFRSTSPDQKNLFQKIQDKLLTFNHPSKPEFQEFLHQSPPLHSFLLFSKLLQNSTQQFIQSTEYSKLLEKLTSWSYYIENLISFGPCSGCHELNHLINQIINNLDEIVWNFKQLSSTFLNSILTINSFADLNCLKDINTYIQELTQKIKQARPTSYKDFQCYFAQDQEINNDFKELESRLNTLYEAVQQIWKKADINYAPRANSSNQPLYSTQISDCISLQYNINQLGNKLNELSLSLPIPDADDISYNQDNLAQLELLEEFLKTLIGTENNINSDLSAINFFHNYSTCVGCLVEQLDVQSLHNSLRNVMRRIDLIKTYIKDSIYTTFIRNIYQISLTTNQIAQCFNYNISSSLLIHTLNSGNLGLTLKDLVTTFKDLPPNVTNIYEQYEQYGMPSNALYQSLQQCNAHLKKIYQSYLAINRCFYPQNYIIESVYSNLPKYTLDNLSTFLQSILSDASQINKTWKSLNTAASSLTSVQEDRFLIPALSELRTSHQEIVTQLNLWTSKSHLNDLESVLFQFLKNLSSILSTENLFLIQLKTTFSNLCMTPCIKSMNQFTQALFLFSEYLKLIPNTHLKDNDAFVSVLLPNFSNVLQSIAQVFALPNDSSKEFCLHFFITQTFINITNVINNAVHSIRKLPSVLSHDSISVSLEDSSNSNIWGNDVNTQLICISNQFQKINNWFECAAQNCQSVQLCNSILFNHLNNLADTYDQLISQADQLKPSIIEKPLCIYTVSSPSISNQQWINILQSFDLQKTAVLKMIDNLQAKLYCSEKIEQILSSLSNTIYDVADIVQTKISNRNIVSLLQKDYSEKILPHTQNIFISVDDINNEIYNSITFFEHHQNQAFCISETTDMVNNVYLKIDYLKNEINNMFKNMESNSTEPLKNEEDMIKNAHNIVLKLRQVASRNFDIPSNIYDTSIAYSLENIAQKIQKTSDYLLLLHEKLDGISKHQHENQLFKCHIDLNSINNFIKEMHQITKEISLNLLMIQKPINWQIKLNTHSKHLEKLQKSCDISNQDMFDRTKQELSKINHQIQMIYAIIFKDFPRNSCASTVPFNFEF